jgi:hypothetical protein
MLVLPTAKVLLYIALQIGPAHPQEVYATSNSESYVWELTEPTSDKTEWYGWAVEGKGFPASDFTRDPSKTMTFDGTRPPVDSVPNYLRVISRYSWKRDTAFVFDNGDRIEKHGDHAFYILNAGGANEKVYTIFYPESCCKSGK